MRTLNTREFDEVVQILRGFSRAREAGHLTSDFGVRHPKKMFRLLGRIFWREEGCWDWMGGCSKGSLGYGTITLDGRTVYVHQLAYEMFVGQITPGKFVMHKCDNPRCCNPAHLILGTPQENVEDMVSKGRNRSKLSALEVLLVTVHDAPVEEIADAFGISEYSVRQILNGNRHSKLTGIKPQGDKIEVEAA